MSVQDMADYLGVTRQTIYHWEWGKVKVPKWAVLVMDTLNRKTGDDIRAFRERHNITAQDLANSLGLDRATIYNWEKERVSPPVWIGLALSKLEIEYQKQKELI